MDSLKTVLLADDDNLVIDELKTLIDWRSLGFQIVASAYNGKRALEHFKKHRPDLVITDIVMPIMDGLELITQIRSFAPETALLILTAYDEFEYAKKALQSGAADYILKNEVATESFYEKLASIGKVIDEQRLARQRSLCAEINGYFTSDVNDTQLPPQLLGLLNEKYHFIVLAQKQKLQKRPSPPKPFSIDVAQQKLMEYERVDFAGSIAFLIFADTFDILAATLPPGSDGAPHLRALCGALHSRCSGKRALLYHPGRLTLPIFRRAFSERVDLLRFHSFFPSAPVMDIRELFAQKAASAKSILPYPPLSRKPEAIAAIRNAFSDLLNRLFANRDIHGIESFFTGFCYHYETLIMDLEYFEESIEARDCEKLTEWFLRSYLRCAESYLEGRLPGYSHPVRQTVSLMLNHYDQPSLSIESLSKTVSMSCGHLSSLFKKETGKTINEYLTDIRVDAAKFLLQNTNDKIYDVAEKVGYTSAQYFSQVFFKKTGAKPLGMRKLIE